MTFRLHTFQFNYKDTITTFTFLVTLFLTLNIFWSLMFWGNTCSKPKTRIPETFVHFVQNYTIKTAERAPWRRSVVFSIKSEHIQATHSVFSPMTLKILLPVGIFVEQKCLQKYVSNIAVTVCNIPKDLFPIKKQFL